MLSTSEGVARELIHFWIDPPIKIIVTLSVFAVCSENNLTTMSSGKIITPLPHLRSI